LGMGEGKVRYRTSSLPKNRSGSGEVISAGTFLLNTFISISRRNPPSQQFPTCMYLNCATHYTYFHTKFTYLLLIITVYKQSRDGILGHRFDSRLAPFVPCYSQSLLLGDMTENHTLVF
jgi:hypothetical protein